MLFRVKLKVCQMSETPMNQPELMTHFDKFVLKAVGTLLTLGIVAITGTMLTMNVTIAKMETSLEFVSKELEQANKDRYSASMAAVDKTLLNSRIDVNSENLTESNRKISVLFKKVSEMERDILKLQK